jgi:hypothetical protein
VIVEWAKTPDGARRYLNTDHIIEVQIRTSDVTGDQNEIEVVLSNGVSYITTEPQEIDGQLGPEALRVLSKVAPEEFRAEFDKVQTNRAKAGLKRMEEANDNTDTLG